MDRHELKATAIQTTTSPTFVVGMNGSGTTMLLDCLGRHPALFDFPYETKVIPYLLSQANRFGDLSIDENYHRLWQYVAASPAFTQANKGQPPAPPQDWRARPRTIATIIDDIFSSFAEQAGKQRWCEKTPQHVQHIATLKAHFPDAKFIHVIRDGRDCAASIHRRYQRDPLHTIYRWKQVLRTGREQAADLGDAYLEVQYEALTSDPEHWMRRVCDFLEVPFVADVLNSRRPRTESAGAHGEVAGKIEAKEAPWKSYFSARDVTAMEVYAGALLDELGYPTCNTQGDKLPTGLKIRYWRMKDYVNEFVVLVIQKLRGKKPLSWANLLASVRTALKQRRANRY